MYYTVVVVVVVVTVWNKSHADQSIALRQKLSAPRLRPPLIDSRLKGRCSSKAVAAPVSTVTALVTEPVCVLPSSSRPHAPVTNHSTGADGIILGPPRTNFSSTTSRTPTFGDADRSEKTPRDSEFRDRFARGKFGGGGADTDFRGSGRKDNYRGRGEERDGEGWSTVKPRKSFGQEGAERFTGRMGGEYRHREDRVPKERDESDVVKDRRRTFETDGDENDAPRRNGPARGRADPWSKETTPKVVDGAERQSNRERIEKAKSWRQQDPDERSGNTRADRGNERYDRRWDREQRPEREPEWLDEPLEEKNAGHTEADLKKFMESMKASRSGPKAGDTVADLHEGPPGLPSFFSPDPPAVKSAPAVEKGPDKFFAAFGEAQTSAASPVAGDKPEASKPAAAKSSRFANLFSAQTIEVRGHTEPSTPAAAPPPPNSGPADIQQQSDADKQAFQALLSKLHMPRAAEQSTPTPPNVNAYSQPPPPQAQTQSHHTPHDSIQSLEQALAQKIQLGSPGPAGPYGVGRPEEPRLRSVPPGGPEILAPRPVPPPSQPPTVRTEHLLQDLVSQRHNAQSQGGGRADFGSDNSAFLMQLMRHPDQRPIEQIMRHPQPQRQASIPHFQEREPEFGRERGINQQRQMRPPQPQQGYLEEQFRRSEGDGRMMQPPQILQRQMAPPGLDAVMPQQQLWAGQGPPPGQRQGPMILPPGLQGPRVLSGPMAPGMPFPGSLPPGVFPPSENMAGPPRGVQPPPGFFAGGPPPGPGFMPIPPGMGGAFPGPDAMLFPGNPFDGRPGMPPPGAAPFRR